MSTAQSSTEEAFKCPCLLRHQPQHVAAAVKPFHSKMQPASSAAVSHLGIVWPQPCGTHKGWLALAKAADECDASVVARHAGFTAVDDHLLASAPQCGIPGVQCGDVNIEGGVV